MFYPELVEAVYLDYRAAFAGFYYEYFTGYASALYGVVSFYDCAGRRSVR